jgi:hypothetical protein
MNARLWTIFACSALVSLASASGADEIKARAATDAATAAPPAVAPAAGGLIGVTMGPGGFSLASVNIVIRSVTGALERQLVSDAEGGFAVKDLPPGKYQVVASKEGFTTPAAATVEVAVNKTANANVQLTQGVFGALRGVTLGPDGFSLAAAQVVVNSAAGSFNRTLVTDADGTFVVRDLPPGSYQISATKDGFTSPTAVTVEVAQNRTANADMQFPQAVASQSPIQPAPTSKPAEPAAPAAPAATVDNQTPFAFGDFTWLNGNPRNKDVAFDTPFFTPEVRFDTHYMTSFNQPKDHTIGGSTESFRSGEIQVEQISVGGDFHWNNVRGRILTMFGLFATTTPRNDASAAVGQWDLRNAYRYVSEAYGGYHFNVNHGLNIDAGIFVSYIGLFSYYNFDNWTYQPSYVSSNTPWFFNGLRIQWFPTNKLKIEPWIINGWQSYGKFNGHRGLGGQILYRPKEWLSLVFNNYGNGTDDLNVPGRSRIHTDDSIEVRYYNKPESTGVSKMAFSLTGDAGCEYGAGVTCKGGKDGPKQAFLGWMLYNRVWLHKDVLGITLGGGKMNNPGRYLTLLPPINGADAVSGSPYFTANPGDRAHMWDSTVTLQYMPKQYITWWGEVGYRRSDIPYFTGRGGITPPGGNNGLPGYYVCNTGASAGTADLTAAQTACGGAGNVWFPDLRKSQATISVGVLVKF